MFDSKANYELETRYKMTNLNFIQKYYPLHAQRIAELADDKITLDRAYLGVNPIGHLFWWGDSEEGDQYWFDLFRGYYLNADYITQ